MIFNDLNIAPVGSCSQYSMSSEIVFGPTLDEIRPIIVVFCS
jgi:hypothetical protein